VPEEFRGIRDSSASAVFLGGMATTISRAAPATCGEYVAPRASDAASEAGVAIYAKRIVRILRQQGVRLLLLA